MIEIKLSVHELIDFILRKGDIDNRIFNVSTMEEGTLIHSRFQRSMINYNSEVQLSYNFPYDKYLFMISGRADGIFNRDNLFFIDEIKSTNIDLEKFSEENIEWHLGQAELYAFIYCLNNNLNEIGIRLSYISQIDYKNKLFKEFFYTIDDLEKKVYGYFEIYLKYVKLAEKFDKKTFESLNKLEFPFPNYRFNQKEIIDETKKVIECNSVAFFDASTGIGKSICFLFATLKEINNLKLDKIFYTTAKNSGFNSAIDAYKILKKGGLKLKAVIINAKEKMCLNTKNLKACNPDMCPFARNYYTKLFSAIIYSLTNYDFFDEKIIKNISERFELCPFELSLDLADKAKLVICDYNYIFNPISSLDRYNANDLYKRSVVLVDEAHNMINRSREMYSASFNTTMIKEAKKDFKKIKQNKIKKNLNDLIKYFDVFDDPSFENNKPLVIPFLDDKLLKLLFNFLKLGREFKKGSIIKKTNNYDNLSLELFKFYKIYDFFDPSIFRINLYKLDDGFSLNLVCLDASKFINSIVLKNVSTIFFSGTIKPIEYYKKMILGNDKYDDFSFKNGFNEKNFKLFINKDLSIKYKDRASSLEKVEELLINYINSKIGNYIIFVPSFEYLKLLKNNIKFNKDIEVIYQEKNMTNVEKNNFLKKFVDEPSKTLVAICVLGGTFSEGIDLPNNKLIGVAVIGVGMPSICFENQQLTDYFNNLNFAGFTYAYIYPGINKIMQSIGRVIRSENDVGTALLIDQRYSNKVYTFLFNEIWRNNKVIHSGNELNFETKKFYKNALTSYNNKSS